MFCSSELRHAGFFSYCNLVFKKHTLKSKEITFYKTFLKVILLICKCASFWALVRHFFLFNNCQLFLQVIPSHFQPFSLSFYFVLFLTVEAVYHRINKIIERKWWLFKIFLVFQEIVSFWWHFGSGVNIPVLPTCVERKNIYSHHVLHQRFLFNCVWFYFFHTLMFLFFFLAYCKNISASLRSLHVNINLLHILKYIQCTFRLK